VFVDRKTQLLHRPQELRDHGYDQNMIFHNAPGFDQTGACALSRIPEAVLLYYKVWRGLRGNFYSSYLCTMTQYQNGHRDRKFLEGWRNAPAFYGVLFFQENP